MADSGSNDAYALIHAESAAGLTRQERAVESFYTRGGLLLAATLASASFLGSTALEDGRFGVFGILATVVLVLVCASTLTLLWPRTWYFTVDAQEAIASYLEPEAGEGDPMETWEIQRDLALHSQSRFVTNARQLRRLSVWFQVAAGGLVVDLVLWVLAAGYD